MARKGEGEKGGERVEVKYEGSRVSAGVDWFLAAAFQTESAEESFDR